MILLEMDVIHRDLLEKHFLTIEWKARIKYRIRIQHTWLIHCIYKMCAVGNFSSFRCWASFIGRWDIFSIRLHTWHLTLWLLMWKICWCLLSNCDIRLLLLFASKSECNKNEPSFIRAPPLFIPKKDLGLKKRCYPYIITIFHKILRFHHNMVQYIYQFLSLQAVNC